MLKRNEEKTMKESKYSYNEENIQKVAERIVNDMDHKAIYSFAVDRLVDLYRSSREAFEDDVEAFD